MMGTANSTKDFFWELLQEAVAGTKWWDVYECDVAEHPDYSLEWEKEMIHNMGREGWEMEMLQKAKDPTGKKSLTQNKKHRSIYDDWKPDWLDFSINGKVK